MFNLTVDEAHTFYVGEGRWLVHNESLCFIDTGIFGGGRFKQYNYSTGGGVVIDMEISHGRVVGIDLVNNAGASGTGGTIIADAVGKYSNGLLPRELIGLKVVNQPTLDALRAGVPIEHTVLGRSFTQAADQLNARVVSIFMDPRTQKMHVIIAPK